MNTTILRVGSRYIIDDAQSREYLPKLPIGNYVVQQDIGGFYLEQIEAFTVPKRIYGDTEANVKRFLHTYTDREKSTGILLSGEKGSGKTLTAQLLSVRGAEEGIVTLVVNAPFNGDDFNEMLQRINQPCIVLFDEFEKVYHEPLRQQALLTLLEGVYTSKKLFVFTCNDHFKVDSHMLNRPGRIYYAIEYTGLEPNFIREYCQANLNDKGQIDAVCRVANLFWNFNFDSLKAIVEEMNRYGEPPSAVLKFLNVRVKNTVYESFEVKLWINGKRAKLDDDDMNANPLAQPVTVEVTTPKYKTYKFESGELTHADGYKGAFTYERDNLKLTLTRKPRTDFNVTRYVDA